MPKRQSSGRIHIAKIRIPRESLIHALEIRGDTKPKTFTEHFKAFSRVSTIHGFGFLGDAINKAEVAFWIILIIGFICLTGRDVTNACIEYWMQYKVTSLTVRRDFVLQFPRVTVCIPVLNNIVYQSGPNEGIYRLENHLQLSVDIFNDAEVDQFLAKYQNDQKILTYMSIQNYTKNDDIKTLVMLTIKMLCQIVSVEGFRYTELIIEGTSQLPEYQTNNLKQKVFAWADTNLLPSVSAPISIFKKVFQLFTSAGISTDQVLISIGHLLCRIVQLQVQISRFGGTHTSIDIYDCNEIKANLTWFSVMPFPVMSLRNSTINACYNVGNLTLKPNAFAEFKFNPEALYDQKLLTVQEKDELVSHIDLTGERNVPQFTSYALRIPWRTRTVWGIEYFGEFHSINTTNAPCAEVPFHDCRGRCRASYILRKCGCWPLSWIFLDKPAKAPLCPRVFPNSTAWNTILPTTPDCFRITKENNPDQECKSQCRDLCNATILMNFDTPMEIKPHDSTVVRIQGKRFLYPIFEEQLKIDTTTFLSNIGGNLGLWLGASFLAVMHMMLYVARIMIIYLVEKWKQAKRRRKELQLQSEKQEAAMNGLSKLEPVELTPEVLKETPLQQTQLPPFEEIEIPIHHLSTYETQTIREEIAELRRRMRTYDERISLFLAKLSELYQQLLGRKPSFAELLETRASNDSEKCPENLGSAVEIPRSGTGTTESTPLEMQEGRGFPNQLLNSTNSAETTPGSNPNVLLFRPSASSDDMLTSPSVEKYNGDTILSDASDLSSPIMTTVVPLAENEAYSSMSD